MRINATAKNCLLLVVSLATCLLLLELGLRVYSAFFFPKMMVLDDKLGWKHAVNLRKTFANENGEKILVVLNAHGHRGKYYDFARHKDKYRILVLGDSFTEGVQVDEEDLFTARLEKMNPQLEVINAGVGGYGTVQEYLYLLSEGLRFNPDFVLLIFFENDLSDNCVSYYPEFGPRPYAFSSNGEIYIEEKLDQRQFLKFTLPIPFRIMLNKHSYLFYYLNSRIYHRLFSHSMRQLQQADLKRLNADEKYETFYAIVKKMQSLLKSRNIDFGIAPIPTREEASAGISLVNQDILNFCQENRIKFVPLLERLKTEIAAGVTPYFHSDMHWTKAGHRIAAEQIEVHLVPFLHRAEESGLSSLTQLAFAQREGM